MDVFQKFKNFLGSLKKNDVIALMYHDDADGLASGVILGKCIERKLGRKVDFLVPPAPNYSLDEMTVNFLKDNKVNVFVSVDMALDEDMSTIREILEFATVAIIDHHQKYGSFEHDRFYLIKTKDYKPNLFYPCAKFLYDLCGDLAKDLDWVSSIGIAGDMSYLEWKPFVDDILKRYGAYRAHFKDSGASKSSTYLNAAAKSCTRDNINEIFDILYNSQSFKDLLNNPELKRFYTQFSKELDKWIKNLDHGEFLADDVFFYYVEPKFALHPIISTILSTKKKFKGKTVVIAAKYKSEDKIHISLRRQDLKVDLAKMVRFMHEKYGYVRGGGHAVAAGGNIPTDKLENFKKDVVDALRNFSDAP